MFTQNAGALPPGSTPNAPRIAPVPERPRVFSPLARLRAVIVWGQCNATPLVSATGRSTLDLPIDDQHTVLGGLMEEISALAKQMGIAKLPVRLLTNSLGAKLLFGVSGQYQDLSVELHPFDIRGTGGVFADAGKRYEDDDYVLTLEASQILEQPLATVAQELAGGESDISVFAHADHSPSVMMLVRCGCLRALPRLGTVDMKTQGLPLIAAAHRVEVVERPQPAGSVIESLAMYISALRRYHWRKPEEAEAAKSSSAPWQPVFSLVENGGDVAPGANLYDAIVLKGGRVEAGATVVRGIVGPGGVVKQRQTSIDSIVGRNRVT
jgi:hypothetical protein